MGRYYKALGMMYLAEDVEIMVDMVPFEQNEVKEDAKDTPKEKSEGEITVFKRVMPQIKEYNTQIAVLDCMFLNGPCLNEAKRNEIEIIAKLTDTRRNIYKSK